MEYCICFVCLGPAGTGKTESVKALGHQLGRFVLVFNCDETFDFQVSSNTILLYTSSKTWLKCKLFEPIASAKHAKHFFKVNSCLTVDISLIHPLSFFPGHGPYLCRSLSGWCLGLLWWVQPFGGENVVSCVTTNTDHSAVTQRRQQWRL